MQQNTQPEIVKEAEEYSGPYNEDVSGDHYFTFVISRVGIDQPAFIGGIEEFNTANYASQSLKVEVSVLDDIRQIILISGLPDKESAKLYFSKVVNSRALYTPLRETNYRNFLISKGNFEIFLNEKNITKYMDFYKRVYLEK